MSETSEIGIILCDCGGKLSQKIDFDQLATYVSTVNHVGFVRKSSHLCSERGQHELQAIIKDGAKKIVIGACSPKLYEQFFMQSLKQNGLHPFFVEMANLREQCAWAHEGISAVNEKAMRVTAAAIENVHRTQVVHTKEFTLEKSVLVIGGGIAGLQAAIDIADYGYPVHIIEKDAVVGGNTLKLGLAFPSNDGAFCISSPDFLRGIRKCFYRAGLLQHPNININTLSRVEEVQGSFGNFEVTISSQPRGVHEELCINCGRCVDVCPIDVANEVNYGLNTRKAIYLPHPNAVPQAYVVDWESCNKCGKCVEVCPTKAVNLDDKGEDSTFRVGAIIVATGLQEYDPSSIKQYNYDRYEDVITQLQFARILDAQGPFHGRLVRPSDSENPETIVMIQCVGSRDITSNSYCSKICCTIALKHAIIIKERAPNTELFICYMDIRTLGKNYEDYFSKARDLGIKFIRGKPSEIIKDVKSGKLIVEVEDTFLSRPLELEADLVVLSAGMIPSTGSTELATTLGIQLGENGFIEELYPKLRPIETSVKGIYVCGGAQGPKDIPESITQAEATAFRAILDLSKDNFRKEMDIAFVNEDDCDGCEQCLDSCPYNAIQMLDVTEKGLRSDTIATIDELRCERCGTCTGRCPTGALQLVRYNDDKVLAQLHELLSQKIGSMAQKVIAFCCNECGYATVDMAGMTGITYPSTVLPVRVPCLGWVSPFYIFRAFELGADGVLLVGCVNGNCQNIKGNFYADNVVTLSRDILDEIGLSRSRLDIVSACAANPLDFSHAATAMVDRIKVLGPILKPEAVEINTYEGKLGNRFEG